MTKNEAMVEFLQTCPTINQNPLFFNFGTIEDNAHQVMIRSDDVALNKPYIDGSVSKRYTFYLDSFKSVAYNPIVTGYSDENLTDLSEVQDILDWINAKGDAEEFPTFDDCIIEEMKSLTTKPELVSVEDSLTPPIAIYRITIQIDYIDNTKKIWD